MYIFPAIDLYQGMAVRLYQGDYEQMTVYSRDPLSLIRSFEAQGARQVHLVDLEGAKNGGTPNLDTIRAIASSTSLFTEVGGGIRSMDVVTKYFDAGVKRVILGTAAVTNPAFLKQALSAYSYRIAVGVDIRDGCVAIKGWTESSGLDAFTFCNSMQQLGVKTLICTDISKDGALEGPNRSLYQQLKSRFHLNIIASGGVSTLDDVLALARLGLHGAIIGKAYYTGAISLRDAIEVAK